MVSDDGIGSDLDLDLDCYYQILSSFGAFTMGFARAMASFPTDLKSKQQL